MCLCIYGDYSRSLSVYLCLMKGSHDDELTWPLRKDFEIKLLNQISDHQHHSVQWNYDDVGSAADRVTVVGDRDIGIGRTNFISYDDLNRVS